MSEFEAPGNGLPQDVVDKLTADFGEFVAVKTAAGHVAMRGAKKTEYNRFYAAVQKESERAVAQENIAYMCVIYANGVFATTDERTGQLEARAALKAMLERKPAILSTIASCALEASGVDADAETKKYGAS